MIDLDRKARRITRCLIDKGCEISVDVVDRAARRARWRTVEDAERQNRCKLQCEARKLPTHRHPNSPRVVMSIRVNPFAVLSIDHSATRSTLLTSVPARTAQVPRIRRIDFRK